MDEPNIAPLPVHKPYSRYTLIVRTAHVEGVNVELRREEPTIRDPGPDGGGERIEAWVYACTAVGPTMGIALYRLARMWEAAEQKWDQAHPDQPHPGQRR